jgi:hypothetical protein
VSDLHFDFVSKSFLRSHWDLEYRAWHDSENEKGPGCSPRLMGRAHGFEGDFAESAFLDVFFRETWGHVQTGQRGSETGFSLYPKFAIPGAGANGGSGEADLAIGYFSKTAPGQIPQVLCEFKTIRSALDADQKRKGNTRSPVRQCLDYLSFARRGMASCSRLRTSRMSRLPTELGHAGFCKDCPQVLEAPRHDLGESRSTALPGPLAYRCRENACGRVTGYSMAQERAATTVPGSQGRSDAPCKFRGIDIRLCLEARFARDQVETLQRCTSRPRVKAVQLLGDVLQGCRERVHREFSHNGCGEALVGLIPDDDAFLGTEMPVDRRRRGFSLRCNLLGGYGVKAVTAKQVERDQLHTAHDGRPLLRPQGRIVCHAMSS